MKKIISSLAVCLLCANIAYAEVSQFVFTNESQTVAPSTISEALTVQAQNSSGTGESITETTDMVFQSTSATGQFLNSSGNPVSTTMSKNTANRTFYYKDSTTGTHTITVTATGRDSQKVFKATQVITVGTPSTPPPAETDPDDSNDDTSTSTTNNTTSSHSSPSSASGSTNSISFEVSAGRKRFSSVASEVIFKAEPIKISGVPENQIQYTWTFGDGTMSQGQLVSHRYRFKGEYVVVLNATYSDKSAVSRTEVSVIEPSFVLTVLAGGVQVLNQSAGEVNVGEWVIEGARTRLEIPRDTIIQKGKVVTFPYSAGITDSDSVVLKNPLGIVIAERKNVSHVDESIISPVISTTTPVVPEPIVKIVYIEKPIVRKEATLPAALVETAEVVSQSEATSTLLASVYTASTKTSALESFFWIPRKGWGMLTNLFK